MSHDELLAHAERSIAVGSKSFATASRLFDPHTRRSAVLLYAWCRHCDDVGAWQICAARPMSPCRPVNCTTQPSPPCGT